MPRDPDDDDLPIEAITQDPQAELIFYGTEASDEDALSVTSGSLNETLSGEHAREMLIDGGLSLESIADMVGGEGPTDEEVFTSPDWDRATGREDFNPVSDLIG